MLSWEAEMETVGVENGSRILLGGRVDSLDLESSRVSKMHNGFQVGINLLRVFFWPRSSLRGIWTIGIFGLLAIGYILGRLLSKKN